MQKMLLLFVLFMAQTVHGQTLSGTVSDAHHAPIAFANIVVLSPDDSTFVSGTTSQADGSFTLTSIQKGQLLKVSCIGYEPFTTIYGGTSPLHITLADATKLLGEVVVKSKRPQTQFKGEGMLTTIAGSLLAKTTSMEQLLNNIPQVSARNGTLEVFGRGTPEVYINNRKMQDNNELTRLQPSEIKTIEVITNPGVRYNAQVKSVIRITTKKLYGEGWGIDAQTSAGINDQTRTSEPKLSASQVGTERHPLGQLHPPTQRQRLFATHLLSRHVATRHASHPGIHQHQPLHALGRQLSLQRQPHPWRQHQLFSLRTQPRRGRHGHHLVEKPTAHRPNRHTLFRRRTPAKRLIQRLLCGQDRQSQHRLQHRFLLERQEKSDV